jgi:EmrB/QacA subfamily drug resistance transporter
MTSTSAGARPASSATLVLAALAAGQFLMTLDSSVMNVSMAQVASDLGTPITGIQTAITLYTLVMASLMITGGKVGSVIGRRRAFALGLVVYGAGSLTTALAPNLPVLLLGWSLLEGMGAALIMPAIVALIAGNFAPERRAAAYGLVAAAGAMAVAAGPLIGGAVTTFASWRYVFAGEVVVVVVILLLVRRVADVPPTPVRLDVAGSAMSIVALSMVVFGVLRSSEWGWVTARPGGPEILGASPVIFLLAGGTAVLYAFVQWEKRLAATGREPLLPPDLLQTAQLRVGVVLFFAQFLVQAGVFFALPLFLTVVLELSPLQTGLRVFPLSVALLISAAGVPRLFPRASPRRVVRLGLMALVLGAGMLVAGMDPGADATVVALPMLVIGAGLGLMSSQLGAITVSAVPDERSADVGGLQNTATSLGASLGTALIGSVLIASLSASAVAGLRDSPEVSAEISSRASIELASGVPFLSDPQLAAALSEQGITGDEAAAIIEVNDAARFDGLRAAFGAAGLLALAALFFTGPLPTTAIGRREDAEEADDAEDTEDGTVSAAG